MNWFAYDLETYPNCFLCCVADLQERKIKVFEISSRKDQREPMFEYLRNVRRKKGTLVGFNNLGFDEPVLQNLLKNKNMTVGEIYDYAMKVIQSGYGDNKWQYQVRDKDRFLQQLDLFKMNHFDNKAKATSLKMIEFNSRSANIEDLPFPVGKYLTSEEMDVLVKYNMHDVKETVKFFDNCKAQIDFRIDLEKKYGFNALNWNDTKIGSEYFIMELEKAGIECYEGGRPRKTKRTFIDLVDCIFPYIKFERPEFNAILEWLRKQRITETKGVFSDIPEHELGDVAKYALMVTKKIKFKDKPTQKEIDEKLAQYPLGWVEEVELKAKLPKKDGGGFKKAYWFNYRIAEALNVVINGLCYVFGTGGLHASLEKQVVCSDDEYIVEDEDVSSFYPNLAIKNKVYPEHLGVEFCDIYEVLYNMRKTFDKKSAENAMLKLALNGTYGNSNNEYSPFYDSKFTMQITINGQLSLCMIVEQLLKLDGIQIIQANTDGLTFKRKRSQEQQVRAIVEWWQDLTKLELERNDYSKMVIRDVNSYLAVYAKDGKLKQKGAYEWKDLPNHKNQSALIVKIMAEKYLVDGTDPEEYVRQHDNMFDFCLRTKVPRSSKLVIVDDEGVDHQTQNICRYYMSKNGGDLVKVMPPLADFKEEEVWVNHQTMDEVVISSKTDIAKYEKKGYTLSHTVNTPCEDRRFFIERNWKCKVVNDINLFAWDIDYDYYTERAWKLINFVDDNSLDTDDNSDTIDA
jgi:hypothetical protein